MIPDKEGIYLIEDFGQEKEIDVYEGPNGSLCIWGPEVCGGSHYEQTFTIGDEMCGHIPVQFSGYEFEYVSPLK